MSSAPLSTRAPNKQHFAISFVPFRGVEPRAAFRQGKRKAEERGEAISPAFGIYNPMKTQKKLLNYVKSILTTRFRISFYERILGLIYKNQPLFFDF